MNEGLGKDEARETEEKGKQTLKSEIFCCKLSEKVGNLHGFGF